MLKLLVADDEQLERMALQQVIEGCYGTRVQVLLAVNGREAARIALEEQADIALLDIEMPGMTGLEAAAKIWEARPQCKLIFLTAYSEFRYAQEAVRLGAMDYLLKPCADRDLLAVIDKAMEGVVNLKCDSAREALSQQRIAHLTERAQESLVLSVMGGYLRAGQDKALLDELGISLKTGVFCILQSPGGLDAESMHMRIHSHEWPPALRLLCYEYDDKLYILASSVRDGCASAMRHALHVLSDQALSEGILLMAALGGEFECMDAAQESFYQARSALPQCAENKRLVQYGAGTARAVSPGDADAKESPAGRGTQALREITEYIAQNYHRDIFLQQVAEEMHYSKAYFSKLFKQCFHKNFVTYLTEVRVEAAKGLLLDPTVNIKEVGLRVGYQDPNYFTKVFRRALGITPTEYREDMLKT